MQYRREIDGLRAIAVVSVILYHAKITLHGNQLFSGGFLGVDIFFVISGFLITSLLLKDIVNNRFSFADFYERRARRILPALFFVMACSLPFAFHYMLPRPFIEYAQSLISSILFVSNIFFWTQDGYTAEPSAFKPFLHTWSLSVEEQYYIFFPVILILLWKFTKNHLQIFLVSGFILSLVSAELIGLEHRDASFFLIPTRAWELFAGAILAVQATKSANPVRPFLAMLFPGLGLLLIAASIFFINDQMAHLSLLMLIPVLGSMLFIHYGGSKNWATAIVSTPLFVGIGLISYSLYLWHQPTFVFFRLAGNSSDIGKACIAVMTFGCAFMSWKYIEQPFRNKKTISARSLCYILASAALLLTASCLLIIKLKGVPERFPAAIIEASSGENPLDIVKDENGVCHNRSINKICVLGDTSGKFNVVALGDSHIGALSPILWEKIKDRAGSYTGMTFSGHYAPGLEISNNGTIEKNSYERGLWEKEYLLKLKPSIIVIGGRLPLYYSGDWFDNREGGREDQHRYYMQSKGGDVSEEARRKAVAMAVKKGILELLSKGHKVVLIYPVPEAGWHVPKLLISNYYKHINNMSGKDSWLSTSYEVFKERVKPSYEIYDSVGKHANLIRVYPDSLFCNTYKKDRCINNTDKAVYYTDGNHLSLEGGELLVDKIMSEMKQRWHIE